MKMLKAITISFLVLLIAVFAWAQLSANLAEKRANRGLALMKKYRIGYAINFQEAEREFAIAGVTLKRGEGCNETSCGLHDMMIEVRDATLSILDNRTLKDLVV